MQHHHLPVSPAAGPFEAAFLRGSGGDEATAPMLVAADFGVTQLVDANCGLHGSLRKNIFTCT